MRKMWDQGRAIPIFVILLSLGLPWVTGEEHEGRDVNQNQGSEKPKHKKWGYNVVDYGPDMWSTLYPEECGPERNRQSPIDIQTHNAVFMEDLKDIDLVYRAPESEIQAGDGEQITSYSVRNITMKNNGHSVSIRPSEDIFLVGGDLGDVYKVFNIHFHWGKPNSTGSEHQIDGRQFPLEMHIVTYDTERYSSIVEAIDKYNSLAVLGTFFEIGEENIHLNPIIKNLDKIIAKASQVNIPWINPSDLLPPETYRYFRYEGSLTTPKCYESVIWTVFNKTNTISEKQLAKFYQLQEIVENGVPVPLLNNWRPPQLLKDRRVYSSFSNIAPSVLQALEEETVDKELSTKTNNTATTLVAMTTMTFLAMASAIALLM